MKLKEEKSSILLERITEIEEKSKNVENMQIEELKKFMDETLQLIEDYKTNQGKAEKLIESIKNTPPVPNTKIRQLL
ncbi:hypothetical protein [Persephonella sp. KM09-Lau-8]|uniref:hypothetical protein n=1 Tax=Persephonella sp. KM09-Lau-8 TaxID=1158345 RepID=UPI000497C145|nr:hypothetical protein [Persephonella sp. KM09-Lau-8]